MSDGNPHVTLLTCSGVSNTGKLSSQAAQALLMRRPGRVTWVRAARPPEELAAEATEAEHLIILNGCGDCCATKKLRAAGVSEGTEVIITDLGIEKNGMAEVSYAEIEVVVSGLLETMGRGRP
ncbi:putative metal-binding protein [Methanolinea mesophila]|uniref:putative zinc-binding protein n=1 Tax=Methanolinea mesophila TaxID=547055 RepID=UPI001AE1B2F1|nr:putative zinc-binding protein [Methanolinea mesophila]MBP1929978.1 putative metal-binding protein [Methanolinea mesophila]